MRRFPKIFIDISLVEFPCRDCRIMIPAMSGVYMVPLSMSGAAHKAICEKCAMREIERRIEIVKDEQVHEQE